jgi:hypothetical protein
MAEEKDKKDDTKLSSAELDRIREAILAKWTGQKSCPICSTNKWTIGPHIITPMRLEGASGNIMLGGGSIYPSVMLVCENCGFTHYFNLVALGIYQELQKKASEAVAPPETSPLPKTEADNV